MPSFARGWASILTVVGSVVLGAILVVAGLLTISSILPDVKGSSRSITENLSNNTDGGWGSALADSLAAGPIALIVPLGIMLGAVGLVFGVAAYMTYQRFK